MNKLRWGILGAALIARKNWKALHNTGNGIVTAVASRDMERTRRFIAECQALTAFEAPPKALASYEELLASKDVDAVYIPLPTGLRKEWVIRAAEAGKHVVCEKPCATSVADLRDMIEACQRHRVQFMDGVMFMHSHRLPQMRLALADGVTVGDIKRITSVFSFPGGDDFFGDNIRMHSEMEPYGCLGDLGWYCLRLALWTMNWQLPRRVTGRILAEAASRTSPAPVPTEFSGELFFDNGVSSAFHCSFLAVNEQWAVITGTKGYLRLSDFVLPFFGSEVAFEVNNAWPHANGSDFNMEAHWRRFSLPEYSNGHPSAQATNLFRNFAAQVQSGTLEDSWPMMALKTQQLIEACFNSARQNGREAEVAR